MHIILYLSLVPGTLFQITLAIQDNVALISTTANRSIPCINLKEMYLIKVTKKKYEKKWT